ncbi:MAG: peptidoglycan-associated lipoprotein Pal [Nitrospirae bacterium]|nr:MAG: peptidoglycan-associated lipoprotein Pal [Nitrospirota bacterium]
MATPSRVWARVWVQMLAICAWLLVNGCGTFERYGLVGQEGTRQETPSLPAPPAPGQQEELGEKEPGGSAAGRLPSVTRKPTQDQFNQMQPAPSIPQPAQEEEGPSLATPQRDGGKARMLSPAPEMEESLRISPLPPESIRELGLHDVFFDFDRASIRASEVPTLEHDAHMLMTEYASHTVLIEGHCDERGSMEYNLVLGMRRAQAVKAYLVALGVQPARIALVSYGKERPWCTEHYEACWQRNRRAHFVLREGD